jgi:hypothetical protein
MATTILGTIAAILFAAYLVRRRARMRAEEDNY